MRPPNPRPMPDPSPSSRYRDAGVDIEAGAELVRRIAPLARRTFDDGVLAGLGGFGGLYRLPDGLEEPVLVCGADGVGTKLLLAQRRGRHDAIGIDLVAMCANDVLTHGARPLLFLDYYACGRLEVAAAAAVVRGIADGCRRAGCALLGGETAEMPRLYAADSYDLAGFCVGVAERASLLPRPVAAGDLLLGLDSSGVHANGFSLVHDILEDLPESDPEMIDEFLVPTTIYAPYLTDLLNSGRVLALAHITGGGLDGNVPRILPDGVRAAIDPASWKRPAVFDWLQERGRVDEAEMRRVFNCGIGMVAAVRAADAEPAAAELAAAGMPARVIGEVVPGAGPARVVYAEARP